MLEGPDHILGGNRSSIHRRQVVPLCVGPQVERVGQAVVAAFPRLGQVALQDVRLGRYTRTFLRHEQATVEESGELLAAERDVEVWIERWRLFSPHVKSEGSAVSRRRTGTGWLWGCRGSQGRRGG